VHAEFLDPAMLGELAENEEIAALAAEVRRRLLRVMDAV